MPARSKFATPKDYTVTIGVEADIGTEGADNFRSVQHPDLRAYHVLANPPFNDFHWFRKDDAARWQWSGVPWTTRQGCPQGERGVVHQLGVPPKGNANFAWLQRFIHHLAPEGIAGVDSVCLRYASGNCTMSSNQSGDCPARSAMKMPKAKSQSLPRQRDVRRALIEADLVDCMVALPGHARNAFN
jgi:type I restriction enzyme M protein